MPASLRLRRSSKLALAPDTSLVGRADDVERVCSLLRSRQVRLLTLTGPAGVGKTRLAIAAAERLSASFDVGYVSLVPVEAPAGVLPAIAQEVELGATPEAALRGALAARLAASTRPVLLVLDNFEHVLAAAPDLSGLLADCPGATALVTSRTRLRVSGERDYPVAPLALPIEEPAPPQIASGNLATRELDRFLESPAIRLFVERAATLQPGFKLDDENAAAIEEICRRLDGLPLAIELAARRTPVLPPRALLTQLEHRLPLLTGGPRDAPERQRTLSDAIVWSFDLLLAREQRLFRRLGVFSGSFPLEAIAPVALHDDPPHGDAAASDPLRLLTAIEEIQSLADQSLIQTAPSPDDEPRFALLETLREFALERLVEIGEHDTTRRRLTDWCVELAERASQGLFGATQTTWVERIEAEYGNLRAAVLWAIGQGDATAALRIGVGLVRFWAMRNAFIGEARDWLDRALGLEAPVDPALRAAALVGAGALAKDHGDYERADDLLRDGLALARNVGEVRASLRALVNLGIVARFRGTPEDGIAGLEEAIQLSRAAGDRDFEAHALSNLALAHLALGRPELAVAYLSETLPLARQRGDRWAIGLTLYRLGVALREAGDLAMAADRLAEGVALWRQHGDHSVAGEVLDNLAIVGVLIGEPGTAGRLFGAADAYRLRSSMPVLPDWTASRERGLARVNEALGDAGFAATLAAGRHLAPDALVAEASALAGVAHRRPRPRLASTRPAGMARTHSLSPRELEILRAVVAGLTDREIAESLYISRRTVTTHVSSILAKLEAPSRTAAATIALREGLLGSDEMSIDSRRPNVNEGS